MDLTKTEFDKLIEVFWKGSLAVSPQVNPERCTQRLLYLDLLRWRDISAPSSYPAYHNTLFITEEGIDLVHELNPLVVLDSLWRQDLGDGARAWIRKCMPLEFLPGLLASEFQDFREAALQRLAQTQLELGGRG